MLSLVDRADERQSNCTQRNAPMRNSKGRIPLLVCVALLLSAARLAAGDEPTTLTLPALEQLAWDHNPTLRQAMANIDVARGRTQQSGAYPNPTVGYTGERIGAGGTPGEMQGLFIDQTIVTGGKLRLNRARVAQEVSQAEAQALAQQ